MKPLPPAFVAEMKTLFDHAGLMGGWPDFLASFSRPSTGGLRANTLKISAPDLRCLLADAFGLQPSEIRPVPWTDDGFYLPADCQPGKLPWHSAGLYYIQEPSAMLPAAVLAARPGDRVLDLCAAPGGKSCRIAADLQGEGLLWANEISADRVRALLHNIELTGCRNSLITQETPQRLAERLPGYFDKILVDAPCSGSGMFRRDAGAIDSWLSYGSEPCTRLQREILTEAWQMLRPGGTLVYSTCTFSISENEEMIQWLLSRQPDASVEPIPLRPGISAGLLSGTVRIWPHLAEGDGHFCAMLSKKGEPAAQADRLHPGTMTGAGQPDALPAVWQAFDRFCRETLSDEGWQRLQEKRAVWGHRLERDCLHLLPPGVSAPEGLKKVKTGLFLGQVKVLRDQSALFEPSQAFLFALTVGDLRQTVKGGAASDLIRRYLRGETVSVTVDSDHQPARGFAAVCLESPQGSWPLGWVKAMGNGLLKNLYPQAWRRMI